MSQKVNDQVFRPQRMLMKTILIKINENLIKCLDPIRIVLLEIRLNQILQGKDNRHH